NTHDVLFRVKCEHPGPSAEACWNSAVKMASNHAFLEQTQPGSEKHLRDPSIDAAFVKHHGIGVVLAQIAGRERISFRRPELRISRSLSNRSICRRCLAALID